MSKSGRARNLFPALSIVWVIPGHLRYLLLVEPAAPMSSPIRNGQSQAPDRSWLSFLKTHAANIHYFMLIATQ